MNEMKDAGSVKKVAHTRVALDGIETKGFAVVDKAGAEIIRQNEHDALRFRVLLTLADEPDLVLAKVDRMIARASKEQHHTHGGFGRA